MLLATLFDLLLIFDFFQEIMEVLKNVASQEGKSEYGLKTGSVFSVVKSQQPAAIKDQKVKQDPKKKLRGPCIQWNSTGSCRATAQGRQCIYQHACNITINAGPAGACGKDHPAKDHPW